MRRFRKGADNVRPQNWAKRRREAARFREVLRDTDESKMGVRAEHAIFAPLSESDDDNTRFRHRAREWFARCPF